MTAIHGDDRGRDIRRILPGVWRAQMPMGPITANCYLVTDGGDGLLIDTAAADGTDATHVLALVEAAGIKPSRLLGMVVTHGHRDHIGYAAALQRELDVPVLMHAAEKHTLDGLASWCGLTREGFVGWLERHGMPRERATAIASACEPEPELLPASVEWVADGEELTVGSMRWRVLHTPGHTNGHICLYEPDGGLLFTGDHLLPAGGGNAHVTAWPGALPDPLAAYHDSVQRVVSLQVTCCLPGHGDPVEDVVTLGERHLARHRYKLDETRDALGAEPLTPYGVTLRLPWGRGTIDDLPDKLQFVALGEVVARLIHLREMGAIRYAGEEEIYICGEPGQIFDA